MFVIGYLFNTLAANKEQTTTELKTQIGQQQSRSDSFKKAYSQLQKSEAEADQTATMLQDRYYWGDFMAEMRLAVIRAELSMQKKVSPQHPGAATGIWIEQMITDPTLGGGAAQAMQAMQPTQPMPTPPMPTPDNAQPNPAANPGAGPVTNNVIQLTCRAVSLKSVNPNTDTPDTQVAYAVETEIKSSPLVDPKNTQLTGSIVSDASNGTFTFTLSVTPTNAPTF
jgi:hypothetical protein